MWNWRQLSKGNSWLTTYKNYRILARHPAWNHSTKLFLAAMHFNENSSRQQSMTKDGNKQYAVSYPKGRSGEGVGKEVKVDQTFNYIADLMNAVVELRELNDNNL